MPCAGSLIKMESSSEGNLNTSEKAKDLTEKSDYSEIKQMRQEEMGREDQEESLPNNHGQEENHTPIYLNHKLNPEREYPERYGTLIRCPASIDLSCPDTINIRHSPNSSRNVCVVDGSICPAIINEKDTYNDGSRIDIITGESSFVEKNVAGLRKEPKIQNEMECPDKSKLKTTFSKWDQFKFELNSLSQSIKQSNIILPQNPTKREMLKYAFSCPPHGRFGRFLTYFLLLMILWGSLVYITHEMALPGGTLFSVLILTVTAQAAGMAIAKIHLPPLLAMLLVGIIFRSVPYVDVIGENIDAEWSYSLRSVALVVILTRAGLGLDPEALKKYSLVLVCLALCPCCVEAVTVSVVSHFLLGFPWKWGFLLGFVLSALSPAVVVPSLLNLSDEGYGVEKGIPTLVIAAASIDDVFSITGFGICLGSIFSKGSSTWQGFKGPLELGVGVGYGIIMGLILWLVPNRKEKNANIYRFLLLFLTGIFAVFGSKELNFDGAGAPGCLCVAFVAGYGWKKQGAIPNKTPVNKFFNFLWILFQPILFGLIGTEIHVKSLYMETVGWGIVIIFVGLIFRSAMTFLALLCGSLTLKERIFVTLAWIPKATVQAAIGSIALDYARKLDDGDNAFEILLGVKVLTIAVLAILITAPIGAIAIMLSGPKLLTKTDNEDSI